MPSLPWTPAGKRGRRRDHLGAGRDLPLARQLLKYTARELDQNLKRPATIRGSYGSAEALSSLLADAGLGGIEVTDLAISCQFSSFEENWRRYLTGEGPNGAYVVGLSDERRAVLKEKLRENLFGERADGPFTLKGKAWAVRGIVS